jgi:hypothetical protein
MVLSGIAITLRPGVAKCRLPLALQVTAGVGGPQGATDRLAANFDGKFSRNFPFITFPSGPISFSRFLRDDDLLKELNCLF